MSAMTDFPGTSHRPAHAPGLTAPRKQQGASLLEVLISVLILGIGMLGIAALQATALRNSQSSLDQSQAVIQSYAILDAMRVNREQFAGYNLTVESGCDVPTGGSGLAGADLQRWVGDLKGALGNSACGGVSCAAVAGGSGGDADCTITVRWDDSRASDAGDAGVTTGAVERQTVTRTRI